MGPMATVPMVEETVQIANADAFGNSVSESPAFRIRRNFPETWLWDSIHSGYGDIILR